ncbi:hypothetical protein [Streptomyces sp. NPDC002788]
MSRHKTTPAKGPVTAEAKGQKDQPTYIYGAIPDDAFGAKTDRPPPKGPEAPPLPQDERFEYLVNNPGMMRESGKRTSRIYPERHQVLHGDATVAAPPSSHTEHE